jgi:hypothetical protein
VKTKIDLEKLTTDLSKMTVKAVDDLTVQLNGISLLYIDKFEGKNPTKKTFFIKRLKKN